MNDPLANALDNLPHGPEFRFVDRITQLDPGRSGNGEYRVRGDEPFLNGHFPGAPLFPGVLLVEAGAQLAGAVAQSDPCVAPVPRLKLAAIRGAKFFGSAVPGQVIWLEATITGRLGATIQADASASCGGDLLMKASVVLAGEPA